MSEEQIYYVLPGKSVLTKKRGCVGPGEKVSAKDFSEGEESIKNLLNSIKGPFLSKGKIEVSEEPSIEREPEPSLPLDEKKSDDDKKPLGFGGAKRK